MLWLLEQKVQLAEPGSSPWVGFNTSQMGAFLYCFDHRECQQCHTQQSIEAFAAAIHVLNCSVKMEATYSSYKSAPLFVQPLETGCANDGLKRVGENSIVSTGRAQTPRTHW